MAVIRTNRVLLCDYCKGVKMHTFSHRLVDWERMEVAIRYSCLTCGWNRKYGLETITSQTGLKNAQDD